ncbi:MAG: ABC transporter ATP-binding protein [Burkholderiaceae bacterium]|nr:ABC transporter ATP-binding protein [Burkholderiaceae bacterium]
MIEARELTRRFGSQVALDRVSLSFPEGKACGIIGPNGSGKSTLFNLLTGQLPASGGRIEFRGEDITTLAPQDRVALGMARTFQLVSVFDSLSAWENLVLSTLRFAGRSERPLSFYFAAAQRKEILEDCRRCIERVGLQAKAGARTSELSYGDKRMLEIGIALSLKPRVLLLDEPLAGLSDHEIGAVVELLQQMKQVCTLIIIEHKISKIMDLVERLSVLNDGSLICEGSPQAVLDDPEVRACYWGKQAA